MITLQSSLLGLGALALATAGVFGVAAAAAGRADCPGTILCPLTAEVLCRDECPTVDPDREDCPGRIECPLTGELVRADRCPVGANEAAPAPGRPSCCQE